VHIHCDSLLVINQVTGVWRCGKPDLIPLLTRVRDLSAGKHITFKHVKGHSGVPGNELADKLCNEVLDKEKMRKKDKLREAIEKLAETPRMYSIEVPSTATYVGLPRTLDSSVYTVPVTTSSVSGWPVSVAYEFPIKDKEKTAQEVWDNLEEEASDRYYTRTGKSFNSLSPVNRRALIEVELERHQKGTK
jgi:hypothetical protein